MPGIEALNEVYKPLSFLERLNRASGEFERILVTSSFGSSSAILLKLISDSKLASLPVHFVNTGFLFPETLAYRDTLTDLLKIRVIEIIPEPWRFELTEQSDMWHTNPDLCCAIKKVEPLENFTSKYDVWLSGIMGWQNHNRRNQPVFMAKNEVLKFHPLVDMTKKQADEIMSSSNLPEHPLRAQGYESIGCMPCTKKGSGRDGRWAHKPDKTECGLHL